MSKIILNDVGSLVDVTSAAATINANKAVIVAAFDNTVSRDGTAPNTMQASLDMNSNRVLNLPQPLSLLEPVRLTDINTLNGGGTISTIPAGGSTNNVLKKNTNTDYDVSWTGTPTFTTVTSGNFIGPGTGLTGTAASLIAGSANTVVTNANLTGPITSVGNATAVASQTGIGTKFVMDTSPILVTPNLGTPSAAVLTSATGLPVSSGISGLGTGVATALAVNVGTAGAPVVSGGVLGTPSSGNGSNLTALNATQLTSGTIPAARTNGHQNGTATNDSAASGEIGEFISSQILIGSSVSMTTSTAMNVTSISLTAGDWDVWGNVAYNPGGTTTITALVAWISTTSAVSPTIPNNGAYTSMQLPWPAGTGQTIPAGMTRISLSGTTTVFLSSLAVFGTSTMAAYGFIGARRAR